MNYFQQRLNGIKAYKLLGDLHELIGSDPISTIECFIKSRNWKQVASKLHQHFLIVRDESILQLMKLECSMILNELEQTAQNYRQWRERLGEVQLQKQDNIDKFRRQNVDESVATQFSIISSSNYSLISGLSQFGQKKFRTPKNLKSRKYKRGGFYEEEWLVESLNAQKFGSEWQDRQAYLLRVLSSLDLYE